MGASYYCLTLNEQKKSTNIPIGSREMCFLHQKHISQLTIIVSIGIYILFYFWLFFRLLMWTVFCCCFVKIDRNTLQVTDECF